jgi:small Trp-rich protein
MLLIIAILALSLLKYFEIGPFIHLSWWWISGLMLFAFIWFEYIERMLGLDKQSNAHEELDKIRKERVAKAFERKK